MSVKAKARAPMVTYVDKTCANNTFPSESSVKHFLKETIERFANIFIKQIHIIY